MSVSASTRILTNVGWVRAEDCADKSKSQPPVSTLTGRYQDLPFLEVKKLADAEVVQVTTMRRHSIDVSPDHQFVAIDWRGNIGLRKARNLRAGDWVARQGKPGSFGNDIKFPTVAVQARTNYKKLVMPGTFSIGWAEFIAFYITEGCRAQTKDGRCGGFQIGLAHEEDPELAQVAAVLLRGLFGSRVSLKNAPYEDDQDQTTFRLSSVDVGTWLDRYLPGDAHSKYLPEFVFRWPRYLQAAFLRCCFAHDGTVKKNGSGYAIGYSTASAVLAKQLELHLINFGIETSIRPERRSGYTGTYWAIEVFASAGRQQFGDAVGFVTAKATATASRKGEFSCDRRVIPNQTARLRRLMPFVQGLAKEKARECVRAKSRVHLNPTRLALILENVDRSRLSIGGCDDFDFLRSLLEHPMSFDQVRSITACTRQPVYEVVTDSNFNDAVNYDGFFGRCQAVPLDLPTNLAGVFETARRSA